MKVDKEFFLICMTKQLNKLFSCFLISFFFCFSYFFKLSLTSKEAIYSLSVKFFGGNNLSESLK